MKKSNLKNHLLVATPKLQDSWFKRSVIYVCQHHTRYGTMGIALTQRISHFSVHEILDQLQISYDQDSVSHLSLFAGGPVSPENGFVIHSPLGSWQSSMMVAKDVALTASRDILEAIARGHHPAKKTIIAMGHSGWAPGQLEAELRDSDWLVVPASPKLLFEVPRDNLWEEAIHSTGVRNLVNLVGYCGRA